MPDRKSWSRPWDEKETCLASWTALQQDETLLSRRTGLATASEPFRMKLGCAFREGQRLLKAVLPAPQLQSQTGSWTTLLWTCRCQGGLDWTLRVYGLRAGPPAMLTDPPAQTIYHLLLLPLTSPG